MVSTTCVEMRTACLPLAASSINSDFISQAASGSRPFRDSSKISSGGEPIRAAVIAIFARVPSEYSAIGRSSQAVIPSRAGKSRSRQSVGAHERSEATRSRYWRPESDAGKSVTSMASPNRALACSGSKFDTPRRSRAVGAYPHPPGFAESFMDVLFRSLKHRPETTQGTGLADVMAYKDPDFKRRDFSKLMLGARWAAPRQTN